MTVGRGRELILLHQFFQCLSNSVDVANSRFNLFHPVGILRTGEFDTVHGSHDLIHTNQLLVARCRNFRD
jgi:hypothetical protein